MLTGEGVYYTAHNKVSNFDRCVYTFHCERKNLQICDLCKEPAIILINVLVCFMINSH